MRRMTLQARMRVPFEREPGRLMAYVLCVIIDLAFLLATLASRQWAGAVVMAIPLAFFVRWSLRLARGYEVRWVDLTLRIESRLLMASAAGSFGRGPEVLDRNFRARLVDVTAIRITDSGKVSISARDVSCIVSRGDIMVREQAYPAFTLAFVVDRSQVEGLRALFADGGRPSCVTAPS